MKENKLQDVPREQRAEMLKDMADKQNLEKVKRHYTEDEKNQMKDFISEQSIVVMDQENEFKKISSSFRSAIKEHKASVTDALVNIKQGYSENEEKVFMFADQEAGQMDVFDMFGEFLYSRKLLPEERQTKVFELKTGTHN